MDLSATDLKIIGVLQTDGRISNVDLAERVGMAPSPCLRRVKALQDAGVISGYAGLVDRRAIGLGVRAVCHVKLSDHAEYKVNAFVAEVMAMEEVTACFSLTGKSDFLLMVMATDLDAYGRFATHRLLRLSNVQEVESSLVLETFKNSTALPLSHLR